MKNQPKPRKKMTDGMIWEWPIQVERYNCQRDLTAKESQELEFLRKRRAAGKRKWFRRSHQELQRLIQPLNDVFDVIGAAIQSRQAAIHVVLEEIRQRQVTYWAWTLDDWKTILRATHQEFITAYRVPADTRQYVLALGYFLRDFPCLRPTGRKFDVVSFAKKVFGCQLVTQAIKTVTDKLLEMGCGMDRTLNHIPKALCEALLVNHNPYPENLQVDDLEKVRQQPLPPYLKIALVSVSRALLGLGYTAQPLVPNLKSSENFGNHDATVDISEEWLSWVRRWRDTSTLALTTRKGGYYMLLKVGRWLAHTHPTITRPDQWTRVLAAEFVATVDRMTIGDWAKADKSYHQQIGDPLSARSKNGLLGSVRVFFRDCQEWGWIPINFNPQRSLATPRATRAQIAPHPRVIQDDVWAKLVWAGLNLTSDDLPKHAKSNGLWYPFEMVQSLAIVWLFAGLRSNEIKRLRVGCIHWQQSASASAQLCFLEVPINKTSTAFTKPVDRLVGETIETWEKIRPPQPAMVDPKTGERVHFLFCFRGKHLGLAYLNRTIIPALCLKAGMPNDDLRGNLTSHRARSTIATQLFNAREPMSLFELQAWLGHKDPGSTQHYAQITPTKLSQSYTKAGYFERNLRTIEVLIDQEVIKTGKAAAGVAWKFYDLGHGYCSYDFFDQCPHRMACAKCSFYVPKESSKAQLLEAKSNLLRMRQEIPLSEDEISAVDDGLKAIESLCQKLVDIPTPDGTTPRQLVQLERTRRKSP